MAFSSISLLWNKWNIRSFVMLSLLLQVLLILFAPIRKKTKSHIFVFLLWLAYLMADWVAAFTIGLISHNQSSTYARVAEIDAALQAFWASFLLLHLGGPDTITAFSLEDSSLWRRHLLSLIFQVGAAIYVFVQIFPGDKALVIPTMLVFFAGVIKNVERTLALNLSSLPRLRKSMMSLPPSHKRKRDGDTSARKDEEEFDKLLGELSARVEGQSDEVEAKLDESTVVKHAYYFFEIFKVFMGDLMFLYLERYRSIKYFQKVSAINALRVISVELNFMYEVLHTKALVIHSKWSYIFRFVAIADLALAFVLFNRLKKHRFPELDVEITYSLLLGGMALDAIALFMLVFSDWTLAKIKGCNTGSCKLDSRLHKLIAATVDLKEPRSTTCKVEPNANATYEVLDTPFIFRRWSESISACNLLSEALEESPRSVHKPGWSWGSVSVSNKCSILLRTAKKKIVSRFRQVSETFCGEREQLIIENMEYVSKNAFMKKLWIFIFKEVESKSVNDREVIKKTFEARGDLFLQRTLTEETFEEIRRDLLAKVTGTTYDNSIIFWHIATEIWYNKESVRDEEREESVRDEEREFSKILSDYMFYLLLNQNKVVSAVAGVAQVTSAAALRHIGPILTKSKEEASEEILTKSKKEALKKEALKGLCNKLYEDPPGPSPYYATAVTEGIKLAREMASLGERKWEVMSGVWVEMLCYAAVHIRGEAHVQVLSKGGELLAFVWLLMAHFGCFYKPGWGLYLVPDYLPGENRRGREGATPVRE